MREKQVFSTTICWWYNSSIIVRYSSIVLRCIFDGVFFMVEMILGVLVLPAAFVRRSLHCERDGFQALLVDRVWETSLHPPHNKMAAVLLYDTYPLAVASHHHCGCLPSSRDLVFQEGVERCVTMIKVRLCIRYLPTTAVFFY